MGNGLQRMMYLSKNGIPSCCAGRLASQRKQGAASRLALSTLAVVDTFLRVVLYVHVKLIVP